MNVTEALRKRRSVRKFTEEAVSREMIDALMHAAMSGPSACNKRTWSFYVVTAPEAIEDLRGAAHYSNITAPLAIVVCGDLERALPMQLAPYWIQDCSAATENILLEAVELGLGAVWCGIHPQVRAEGKVRKALGIGEKEIPLNIIWVGHPAETPEPKDWYEESRVHFVE